MTQEYLYDMFGGSTFSTPAQTPLLSAIQSPAGFTLVHRPRRPGDLPATADSDGYSSEGSLLSDFEEMSLSNHMRDVFPRPNSQTDIVNLSPVKNTMQTQAQQDPISTFHSTDQSTLVDADDLRDALRNEDDVLYAADDSETDSDWSDLEDDPSVVGRGRCGSDHQLYMLDSMASSTETIVAAQVSDQQNLEEEGIQVDTEQELVGSDWEITPDAQGGDRAAG